MLPARTLTFQFDPVVVGAGSDPEEWEIVLTPLTSPLDGTIPDAQLVGERQSQTFKMGDNVTFSVVPSDAPGLGGVTTWYRVGWRPRFFGRLVTYDFTMPDADLTFNELQDLGKVIGDSVYLRQSDLGVHVAAIDDAGFVLDGNGDRLGEGNVTEAEMATERQQRAQGDESVTANFQAQLAAQITATLNTATARINAAVATLQSADMAEFGARTTAVSALNATMNAATAQLNAELGALADQVDANATILGTKADLVNGKLVTSQLPTLSLTTAVAVADQIAMLSLTPDQVQPGDIAVRPDGSWLLLTTPISTIDSWIELSTGGGVTAINGQEGNVHLGAADVGAIALGAMIAQNQITGLSSALAAKANQSDLTTLSAQVAAIAADATLVHTVSGLIAKTLMPVDVVFVDTNGLLRKKDGTLIAGQGGSGGPVDWTQIVNTPSTFPAILGTTAGTAAAGNDARLSDTRTPTAHATSHAAAGSDPLTLSTTQVTGLSTILTNDGNRISGLETRVDSLEAGGGGGGGGSSAKTLWFDGTAAVDEVAANNFAAFQTALVLQKGPWGQAGDGSFYYDPAGAANDEWRWPTLTPNGHLKLIKWDETAPADPAMATQAALDAANTAITAKADSSALTSLAGTVAAKADGSVVTALAVTVASKANQSALDATNATVATKADASALATTNSTLANLTTTVGGKADSSFLSANYTNNTALAAQMATKADKVNGTVPLAQIPTGIPEANVANLTTDLAAKAPLVAGVVPLLNLPAYPTSKVTNLDNVLAAKADLIGGKLATSQLPSLATSEVVPVANLAAMLALTTTQVQQGDICVITATNDQGTYILNGSDPSVQANWVLLSVPSSGTAVTGIFSAVSGTLLTGNVTLTAADVGARSTSALIGSSDLTSSLSNTINSKANASDLAAKTSPTDVTNLLISQATTKVNVNVVATTNISLSGTPIIDGVALVAGNRVLAVNQTSKINNGIYVVGTSGTWLRSADMAGPNPSGIGPAGVEFIAGTLVIVTSGTLGANSVYQCLGDSTGVSGVVGVAQNLWVLALQAGPPLRYGSATNSGITVDNVTNPTSPTITVKNTTGIALTSAGVGVDHNRVPFYVKGIVPAGNANTVITHGLGNADVMVVVFDNTTGAMAGLLSWTAQDVNNVVLEFSTAPTTNQYRYLIFG